MPVEALERRVGNYAFYQIQGLIDRRPTPLGVDRSAHTRWYNQTQIEFILYSRGTGYGSWQPTGAMQKLVKRTQLPDDVPPPLVLRSRRTAIEAGLLSEAEWDVVDSIVHTGSRAQTLLPRATVVASIKVLGWSAEAQALLTALGEPIPASWQQQQQADNSSENSEDGDAEAAAASEEAEEAEEEAEEAEEDAAEEEEDEDEDEEEAGEADEEDEEEEEEEEEADSSTESFSYHSNEDDDEEGAGPAGPAADDASNGSDNDEEGKGGADEDDDSDGSDDGGGGGAPQQKIQRVSYTLKTIPESLERELTAWGQWRSDPINHRRGSARVEPTTVAGERADVLRFLGWLYKRGVQPSVVAVFASPKLGVAVETFVKELVKNGRLYSTCAGYVASCIAAARFSLSVRQRRGETPSTAPIDALVTLHVQCKQQAATQQKYARKQDGNWLTWEQCQRARVAAVDAYHAAKAVPNHPKLQQLLRDALLLTWLTHQPPDRVGVARRLQYGVTLVRGANGEYTLDLSQPSAHKTAAVFGPSVTSVHAFVVPLLNAWIELTGIARAAATQPFIFFAPNGGLTKPISSSGWTHAVEACFKRHTKVALSPKDLRSSFITWLKNGEHGDETLRAAARSMRHSDAIQGSDAYDKDKNDRLNQAAVTVAAAFAARFQSSAGASSSSTAAAVQPAA